MLFHCPLPLKNLPIILAIFITPDINLPALTTMSVFNVCRML